MDSTKTEKYGVARNGELLDRLYDTVVDARRQHAHISQTMESIGLAPDVDLVSTVETVTYSKLKVIVDPEPEQPAEDTDTTSDDTEQSA